jgi:hypothetical protein
MSFPPKAQSSRPHALVVSSLSSVLNNPAKALCAHLQALYSDEITLSLLCKFWQAQMLSSMGLAL